MKGTGNSERPAAAARRYGPDYVEDVVLSDGTQVRLRTVRASDRAMLAEGFARLSSASRQSRFFGPKARLTDAELAYLTDVDGEDHFAIGAATVDPDGREDRGVAVARFVRDADRSDSAEAAIAVLDALQNKRLGRLLLVRLTEAALERGVRSFHCEVLAPNVPVRALIEEFAPGVRGESDGEVVRLEIPLEPPRRPEPPADADSARVDPLSRALALVAKGTLVARRIFGAMLPPRT